LKKLILFGNGQIAEIFTNYFSLDSDYEIVAYCVDDVFCKNKSFKEKPLIPLTKVKKLFSPKYFKFFVALSYADNNSNRKKKYNELKKMGYKFANFISSKSNFVSNIKYGENIAILENLSIQPFVKIENNIFIWSGSVIGHHSHIKSHSWITAGSNIGGNVKIGEKSFLGLNSTIGHMVHIGNNCFIGANTLLTSNLQNNSVCIVNDTKKFKLNTKDFYRLSEFK
jgi:sugar O-acyltransferase (sialic acid O-acetyltransferase NeuD family)